MAWLVLLVLLVLCLLYILVGAGIFYAIENEEWPILSYDEAIYLCVTIVTTIGDGSISPLTKGGRVFCIFYVLVGLPLVVVTLSSLCTQLRRPLTWLHETTPWYPPNLNVDKLFKSLVVFGAGTLVMTLLRAIVLVHTETMELTYLDAVYFCVITLSTIGFGDIVAGTEGPAPYKVLVSVWLCVSFVFMAMLVWEITATYFRFATSHTPLQNAAAERRHDKATGESEKGAVNIQG